MRQSKFTPDAGRRMNKPLTLAQLKLLQAACHPGGAKRNARAYRTIVCLRELGLVTSDVEVWPDALRGRHTLHYTVTATAAGRALFPAK